MAEPPSGHSKPVARSTEAPASRASRPSGRRARLPPACAVMTRLVSPSLPLPRSDSRPPPHVLARSLVCPGAREAGPAAATPRSLRAWAQACSCSRGLGADGGERARVSAGVCLWGGVFSPSSSSLPRGNHTGHTSVLADSAARLPCGWCGFVSVCRPFPELRGSTPVK